MKHPVNEDLDFHITFEHIDIDEMAEEETTSVVDIHQPRTEEEHTFNPLECSELDEILADNYN